MGQVPEHPKAYNEQLIAQVRQGGFDPQRPMLLLTTTGAKSGREHTTPVMFIPDGTTCCWSPRTTAPRRTRTGWATCGLTRRSGSRCTAVASPVTPRFPRAPAARSLFERIVAQYPFFGEYQQQTDRVIPVVVVHRL